MKSGTVSLSDPLVVLFYFLNFFFYFSLVYVSILHASMSIHHMHVVSSEEHQLLSGARVKVIV